MDVFTSFFKLLYSLSLRQGGEDKLRWGPSKRGMFDVRSFHNVLVPHESTPFPLKSILQHNGPLRVAFLAWITALGKILTLDNLRKQSVIVIDWCCMCKRSGEIVDRLLLHCDC